MTRFFLPFVGVLAVIYAIFSDVRLAEGEGFLSAPGVATVPLAVDRAALHDLARLAPGPGTFFRAPNSARVRVIDRRMGAVLVEVMDGDQAGRRGWAFAEWVSPK